MSLVQKQETDIEVKASANKMFDIWKDKPYQIPDAVPDKLQSCELQEGEWGKVGSVLSWTHIKDGKARVAIERVEAIDEENKSITLRKIGGEFMEHFKSFNVTMQFIPKGEGSVVKWISDYEKLHDGIPDPNPQIAAESIVHIIKNVDALLLKPKTQHA
ncbi:MLP-like protein 31 [Ziziphus jujuba]|uniref:MLP-like protein 31 n=1 Tax=Ziziphus jujuba TaxID=326968 RepID=A0A6P4AM16_ZIZJJ|nr:MLP-like protein 31 [Ziziphus jujuba]